MGGQQDVDVEKRVGRIGGCRDKVSGITIEIPGRYMI